METHSNHNLCTTLVPLYRRWGKAIEIAKDKLRRFFQRDDPVSREELEGAIQHAHSLREQFRSTANRLTLVLGEVEIGECVAVEAMAVQTFIDLFNQSFIISQARNPDLMIVDGRITSILLYSDPDEARQNTKTTKPSAQRLRNMTEALACLVVCKELTTLCLEKMLVTSMTMFPAKLQTLDCSFSPWLTEISRLPSVTNLFCDNNASLRTIDVPSSVRYLICSRNPSLRACPTLPVGLEKFYCQGNFFESLPATFPSSLLEFVADDSSISRLPELPPHMTVISIKNTPASRDPQVQKQLQNYQKSHSSAKITY